MRLSDYEPGRLRTGGRRSPVELLPADVLDQILEARRAGTHSVPGIVRWLHDETIHGTDYQHVTVNMVGAWLRRKS